MAHSRTLASPLISRRRALRSLAGFGAGVAALSGLAGGRSFAAAGSKPKPPAQNNWPTHRRFKLGGFEVTILSDGASYPKGPYPTFGAGQFEEDVAEVAVNNFIPTERFELSYAPVVINTGKEVLLFDTGNGKGRGPGRGFLPEALRAAGILPEQIDGVVITHAHPDHIGGILSGGTPVFRNARYIVGAQEYNFWSPRDKAEGSGRIASRAQRVQEQLVPVAEKASFIKNDGEVAPGIRAVFSPGHTPGHLAYHVESQGKRMMIWGDAIVHYVMSIQRPEWELSADMDQEDAVNSRKMLLDMAAADRLLVTGYHLPFPAVGYIEKMSEGYFYHPASYQLDL